MKIKAMEKMKSRTGLTVRLPLTWIQEGGIKHFTGELY